MEQLPPVYCCHCLDCQTWSGSAFTEQGVVREDSIAATGPIVDYRFTSPSGSQSHQRLCGTCHTRLWNTNSARPGIAVVRAGTFDASHMIEPRLHIWTSRKQPWLVLPEGIPVFGENAPPAEFAAILMR
ncbi:GFA family protein [Sphingomonas sp. QA11]|uniref:GFA family protein n=1 Tax=Sphingomonas sp. QA11 TaxID=2950605 RepID=UPI00234B4E03|nr:GFA family protein [Sphingomonas sp. QA11]WCM29092.1 GFA family protein [Sphingomonas sp. QA11]